ncbi:hypothetical protein NDU88_005492 [Pleurodeles waltl]|uniref:Uncharacterized protein n=1 Tax=Pleurodeles waltl TaxID=8319 RepID=A0AAV7PFJ2_PLEWA|nr:hypothetical protein NDU88_005492 [Pleurodeles waltl]
MWREGPLSNEGRLMEFLPGVRVSRSQQEADQGLEEDSSLEEVPLKALNKSKARGSDGFPVEFYRAFVPALGVKQL